MSGSGDLSDGTVFIAEDVDPEEQFILTGLFAGHLERDSGLADTFEDLPADEAVAWGRERARIVQIRTGDSDYYSAGVENPEGLPEWPFSASGLERRRARGFEALDNTEDDPPVLWDVRIEASLPRFTSKAKRFRDAIRRHPATIDVESPAPGYERASAAFLVEASTLRQARSLADSIMEQAFQALGKRKASLGGAAFSSYEVYPHRPVHPVSGPGITY